MAGRRKGGKGSKRPRENWEERSRLTRAVFLTIIIPRACVGYEMIDSQLGATRLVGYNHLKREWNNCFIKNASKLTRTFTLFVKHGIMAHIP